MKSFTIKLRRIGRWKKPFYMVVVSAKGTSAQSGKVFEKLGFYAPSASPKVIFLSFVRVAYWVGRGAKVTESVAILLSRMLPSRTSKT